MILQERWQWHDPLTLSFSGLISERVGEGEKVSPITYFDLNSFIRVHSTNLSNVFTVNTFPLVA